MKIYAPAGASPLAASVAADLIKNIEAEPVELNQLSQNRSQNPLERYRALKKAQHAQRPQRPRPWYSR